MTGCPKSDYAYNMLVSESNLDLGHNDKANCEINIFLPLSIVKQL